MEIWENIRGYVGAYQISNLGSVRSIDRCVKYSNGYKRKHKGKTKIPYKNKHGYYFLHLCKKNILKNYTIHRLVAIAFLPNPHNYPCINHINGVKADNRIENLEWCTIKMNNRHAVKLGLTRKAGFKGESNPNSKLTYHDVVAIKKRLQGGEGCQSISNDYPVVRTTIWDIKNKRIWRDRIKQ